MTIYVALLRAVSVGGTGKLSMGTLKSMCSDFGLHAGRDLYANGNVVLDSRAPPWLFPACKAKAQELADTFAWRPRSWPC